MEWSNQNIYEGQWKGALRNGKGFMTYSDGDVV